MNDTPTWLAKAQDWLVRKGINAEIRKSGLREEVASLPFGCVSYLRSKDARQSSVAVVMLHGAAADNTSWIRFAGCLKAGLPLIIPDLPGHGKSVSDPAMQFSIQAQAEYLDLFFRSLGLSQVHLIGNSMGGAIAIRLAATYPDLVASLVLIGTAGVHEQDSWLEQHIATTGSNPMISVHTEQDYLAMMRIGMHKPPFMPGFVVSSLARAFMARSRINRRIAEDIATDLDQSDQIARISCPVQLVWGREDRVSSVSNAPKLQRLLPSSQLVVIDGVGHVPMVEAPKEVAHICSGFLPALG